MTKSEETIWIALKRRQWEVGAEFEPQQVIAGYIPDFVERESMLIVEIDGKIHDRMKKKDAIRTVNLNSAGYTVIRYTNEEALHRTEQVVDDILSHCNHS